MAREFEIQQAADLAGDAAFLKQAMQIEAQQGQLLQQEIATTNQQINMRRAEDEFQKQQNIIAAQEQGFGAVQERLAGMDFDSDTAVNDVQDLMRNLSPDMLNHPATMKILGLGLQTATQREVKNRKVKEIGFKTNEQMMNLMGEAVPALKLQALQVNGAMWSDQEYQPAMEDLANNFVNAVGKQIADEVDRRPKGFAQSISGGRATDGKSTLFHLMGTTEEEFSKLAPEDRHQMAMQALNARDKFMSTVGALDKAQAQKEKNLRADRKVITTVQIAQNKDIQKKYDKAQNMVETYETLINGLIKSGKAGGEHQEDFVINPANRDWYVTNKLGSIPESVLSVEDKAKYMGAINMSQGERPQLYTADDFRKAKEIAALESQIQFMDEQQANIEASIGFSTVNSK